MEPLGLKLFPIGSNDIADLNIVNGQFEVDDGFDTALFISLFEEKRADQSEQAVNFLRRGWWGNELQDIPGFEIGSKLWLVYQARKTQTILNLAQTYARDGLQWLIDQGFLDDLTVDGIFFGDGIKLTINLIRSNDIVATRSFDLWNNTGSN